ncbi:hypothetical protein R3P38DRAFT_2793743 [Favolaschia claudopus]|uniref:Uncharacterized protein n=1 Tax=Favolaschia claudopus TaxID=2862362 RepID=A0AAW0AD81_9AGAR
MPSRSGRIDLVAQLHAFGLKQDQAKSGTPLNNTSPKYCGKLFVLHGEHTEFTRRSIQIVVKFRENRHGEGGESGPDSSKPRRRTHRQITLACRPITPTMLGRNISGAFLAIWVLAILAAPACTQDLRWFGRHSQSRLAMQELDEAQWGVRGVHKCKSETNQSRASVATCLCTSITTLPPISSTNNIVPLTDHTNTVSRQGKPNAGPSGGRDSTANALQNAIPGAKPNPKRKAATTKKVTQEMVNSLNARIAELEEAAAAAGQKARESATAAPPTTPATPAPPRRVSTASRPPVARPPVVHSARQERTSNTSDDTEYQLTRVSVNTGSAAAPTAQALKMIPDPGTGVSTQIGMRLANSEEGKKLHDAARAVIQDCVKQADFEVAVAWKQQDLEKKLLVVSIISSCFRKRN